MVCEVSVPEDGVVNAAFLAREVGQDGIETAIVAGADKPLRVAAILVAAPRRDESCEMPVALAKQDAVVSVPRVCDRLVRPPGD